MNHNLIVDIGNSNIKLAIFDQHNAILFKDIVSSEQLAPTLSFLNSKYPISRSITANVAGTLPIELQEFTQKVPFHMELNAST